MCLQLVTKLPAVYGNRSSVSCSRRPIICTTSGMTKPVHTFPVSFLKIHSNILPPTPRSSTWSLSFMFPPQKPCMHFSFSICATCSTHLNLIYLITQIIFSSLLLLHTSCVQTPLSAPHSQTPNTYVIPPFETEL